LHWQERKKTKLLAILLERSPYYQKRGVKNISLLERESYLEHFDELNTLGFKKADVLAFCEAGERIGQLHRDYRGETVGLSSGTGHQRGIFIVAKSERVRYSAHFISKVLPRSIFSRHRIAYFLRADNPLY
jgi:phenylacetate-coenzyme A ligase PaaK-like adenylate-forming protein